MSWQLYSFKTNTFTIQDENSGSIGTLILLQLETNCQIDFAYNYWPHKTIIFSLSNLIALFLLRSGILELLWLQQCSVPYLRYWKKAQSANYKMRLLTKVDTLLNMYYLARAGSYFYGTEYEIWADFGPVGNTEKKNWDEQLLRAIFSCFHGQKNILFNFYSV